MKFYNDILGLIGNTPLVRINHITKQHKVKAQVFAKMESLNPGYSVKDRIGISMIDWAEKEGVLKKGGTIIEATSGNTGIGLALVASMTVPPFLRTPSFSAQSIIEMPIRSFTE